MSGGTQESYVEGLWEAIWDWVKGRLEQIGGIEDDDDYERVCKSSGILPSPECYRDKSFRACFGHVKRYSKGQTDTPAA